MISLSKIELESIMESQKANIFERDIKTDTRSLLFHGPYHVAMEHWRDFDRSILEELSINDLLDYELACLRNSDVVYTIETPRP